MCDTQCHQNGFKYDDIASVMVEDDGEPHTINLCKCVDNWTQDEKKEPRAHGQQMELWSSRGKLSAGLGACGLRRH